MGNTIHQFTNAHAPRNGRFAIKSFPTTSLWVSEPMTKMLIIAYIVFIHVLLGVVLLKSDFIARIQYKLGASTVASGEISEEYPRMVLYHSRMDGNVPEGAVIFVGDSIIQSLYVAAVAPDSVNYGISNDTTVGLLQRLPTYGAIKRAGAVVVAIGTNDLTYRNNEEILRNFATIAEQLPKNIPVIFSAPLPIAESAIVERRGWNERIRGLSIGLKALVDRSSNLILVDIGPLLVDSQKNLAAENHTDGIHLNTKGNALLIRELQKALKSAPRGGGPTMNSPQRSPG